MPSRLLDHEEPETEEEAKLPVGFFQTIQDLGDCWSEMESSQQVETRFLLPRNIKASEAAGFLVLGSFDHRKVRSGNHLFDCPVAIITIVRAHQQGHYRTGRLGLADRQLTAGTRKTTPPVRACAA